MKHVRVMALSVLIHLFQACDVCGVPTEETTSRPNFVIIMVDDMGFGDPGCYGGTLYPTPRIDRMALEGLRFTDFHSSGCVCSPTRAGLMTGRYQQRAGIPGVVYAAFSRNRHHGLQASEVTLPEVLSASGYRTAMFGKWHLGYEPQYNPVRQGFEQYIGYVSGNVDFHTHIDGAGEFDWWHGNRRVQEPGYTTHLITQHSCEFIRQVSSQKEPFFVYIAHEAPHDPYQGPQDPPVRIPGQHKQQYDHREPAHAARAYREMIAEMDRGVGEILDVLQECNVERQTLVFFLSDNGATGPGSCGDLFGMKGTLWEGGHRVPAIVRWPGIVAADSVSSALTCSIDLMPTVLSLADTNIPEGLALDGRDLTSILHGGTAWHDRRVFWQYGRATSMRHGKWKLIVDGGKPPKAGGALPHIHWEHPAGDGRESLALFDLDQDLSEQINLADLFPQRVQSMANAIQDWRRDVNLHATPQPESH